MRGFQLWINLPAQEKMKPAGYRDIPPPDIPVAALAGGGRVKVIAGAFEAEGVVTAGPVQGLSTEPQYFDVSLPAGGEFVHRVPPGQNAFIYVFEGELAVGPAAAPRTVKTQEGAVLGEGDVVGARAGAALARFLLLAARPLGEPIVQYGPFVMNTREEIEQAIVDYQSGRFATP